MINTKLPRELEISMLYINKLGRLSLRSLGKVRTKGQTFLMVLRFPDPCRNIKVQTGPGTVGPGTAGSNLTCSRRFSPFEEVSELCELFWVITYLIKMMPCIFSHFSIGLARFVILLPFHGVQFLKGAVAIILLVTRLIPATSRGPLTVGTASGQPSILLLPRRRVEPELEASLQDSHVSRSLASCSPVLHGEVLPTFSGPKCARSDAPRRT